MRPDFAATKNEEEKLTVIIIKSPQHFAGVKNDERRACEEVGAISLRAPLVSMESRKNIAKSCARRIKLARIEPLKPAVNAVRRPSGDDESIPVNRVGAHYALQ